LPAGRGAKTQQTNPTRRISTTQTTKYITPLIQDTTPNNNTVSLQQAEEHQQTHT